MVQKRRSHLERIRHAHPVYLGQYVSRKVGFCVEILHFAQGVRGGTVFQKGQKRVVRRRLSVCPRSEEHTSELQSHSDLVCRLLVEKKNILTRLLSDVVR